MTIQTRLYRCWADMKNRSTRKYLCGHQFEWDRYEVFKDWALRNGYADDLVLARINYEGEYTSDNCEWIPQEENARRRHAEHWVLTDTSGNTYKVYNLKKFCKLNGLRNNHLYEVASGHRRHHLGWTARKVYEDDDITG